MKRIVLFTLILACSLLSCKKKSKENFISLTGKIENNIIDTDIIIRSTQIDYVYKKLNYEKVIQIDKYGKFSDTLNFPNNDYDLLYNGYRTSINLEKGYDLDITFDSQDVISTLNYSGQGYILNQFNSEKQRLRNTASRNYTQNGSDDINLFIKTNLLEKHDALIKKYKGLISDSILEKKKSGFDKFYTSEKFVKLYLKKLKSNKSKKLLIGKGAKEFSFEDQYGSTISLSDFIGKIVLIDIWATWCGPCKYELPYFEKIQKRYKNDKISFISISIDDSRDKNKWIDFLEKESPMGIQLFENKNGKSEFISDLNINSIPKYLLIDPSGKFVSLDAPKPSSEEKLTELIDSLLKKYNAVQQRL